MPESELWRLFIALELNDDTRRRLVEFQRPLTRLPCHVSWCAPESMHLTLLFLGDSPAECVPDLGRALDTVAAGFRPFTFTTEGLGTFGPARSPRVVWCGVREGRETIIRLQAAVCEAARRLGFFWSDTCPYSPHITLGRVKAPAGADLLMRALSPHAHDSFGAIRATDIRLLRSQLRPDGAAHTVLHAAPLGETASMNNP